MVKNSPISAGDMGSIPDPGRSHMLYTATEPALYSLGATVTEANEPQNLCFTAREATAMRSQHTTTRE